MGKWVGLLLGGLFSTPRSAASGQPASAILKLKGDSTSVLLESLLHVGLLGFAEGVSTVLTGTWAMSNSKGASFSVASIGFQKCLI